MTGQAEILSTHTPALFRAAVVRAADLLKSGELVALPTETVYGLAANALDPAAVAKIFAAKGRPAHNPLIVHVSSLAMARRCVREWSDTAGRLAAAFWPGPLTVVLPRSSEIPEVVTAGGPTVGVRWPGHPFIQEVIRACGFPLAAPSANASNEVSPTNAAHVDKSLGGKIRLIVDGGQSQVGIESTVVDLVASPPRVLRPGMIHEESLMAAIGKVEMRNAERGTQNEPMRSPGQLQKHYSPKAKLCVLNWKDDLDLRRQIGQLSSAIADVHILAHTNIPSGEGFGGVSVIPHDAEAFARAFYGELHRLDDLGAKAIIVESLPESAEWRGIADRLARAAAE